MGIYNISECLRLFVVPLNTLSPNPPLPVALLHIPTQVRFQCTQVGQSNSNFFDSRHQTRHHQIRLRPASQIHTYSIPVWDMKDTNFSPCFNRSSIVGGRTPCQISICASSSRTTTRNAGRVFMPFKPSIRVSKSDDGDSRQQAVFVESMKDSAISSTKRRVCVVGNPPFPYRSYVSIDFIELFPRWVGLW